MSSHCNSYVFDWCRGMEVVSVSVPNEWHVCSSKATADDSPANMITAHLCARIRSRARHIRGAPVCRPAWTRRVTPADTSRRCRSPVLTAWEDAKSAWPLLVLLTLHPGYGRCHPFITCLCDQCHSCLAVMRLTKPTLFTNLPVTCEDRDLPGMLVH